MNVTFPQTLKGKTRQYRKAFHRAGSCIFPRIHAFHAVNAHTGAVIEPQNLHQGWHIRPPKIVLGAAPEASKAPVPVVKPIVIPSPVATEPEVVVPKVFKRVERVGKDGDATKKRVDYREVKNPKSGESYWIKKEIDGKQKYVLVPFSSLLRDETQAAAA